MTASTNRVRRATLDDLGALKPLWTSMRLPAADLEKRLTEFQVIESAEDYESLRAALRDIYRGVNPRALAELTQKALLLGELGGRFSAMTGI